MESRTLDDRIVELAGKWSYMKRGHFPRWDYHELLSEAYIAAKTIGHRYEEGRAAYTTFLWSHLFCPVSRSYYKAFSVTVTRENRTGKRLYRHRWRELPEDYDHPQSIEPEQVELNLGIDHETDLLYMLGVGMNQKQIAYALGLSEGRISQRVRRVREELS